MDKKTIAAASFTTTLSSTLQASLPGLLSAALPFGGPSVAAAMLLSSALTTPRAKAGEQPLSEKEQMRLVEWQVNLAKEFAIARRIDTAEKVTIEEFYEAKGAGKLEASADPAKKAAKAEVGGSGERVTKRIYTFEGVRELTPKEEAQMEAFLKSTVLRETPSSEETAD